MNNNSLQTIKGHSPAVMLRLRSLILSSAGVVKWTPFFKILITLTLALFVRSWRSSSARGVRRIYPWVEFNSSLMSVKLPQELRASERMRSARWPRPYRSEIGDCELRSAEFTEERKRNENRTCCSVSSSCSSLSCMLLTFSSGNFCISTTCSTNCSYKLSLAAMERKGLRYREARMSTPLL